MFFFPIMLIRGGQLLKGWRKNPKLQRKLCRSFRIASAPSTASICPFSKASSLSSAIEPHFSNQSASRFAIKADTSANSSAESFPTASLISVTLTFPNLSLSIGVALSSKKQVVAIVGDGSFMSNIQELAVIKEHQPNIKFIILNNSGYLSIRNTQSRFYKRVHGVDSSSGLWFPKFSSIAKTFEIDYTKIKSVKSLSKLKKILKQEGPMIVDIRCKFGLDSTLRCHVTKSNSYMGFTYSGRAKKDNILVPFHKRQ